MNAMRNIAIALMVLCMIPAAAMAANYQHGVANVQVDVPDNWTVESDEDSLSAVNPGQTVALEFHMLKATDLSAALDEVDDALDAELDDVEIDEEGAKKLTINTLDCLLVEGTGSVEGTGVLLACALLDTPHCEHILLVFGVAAEEAGRGALKAAQTIFESIRPIMETLTHQKSGIAVDCPFDWVQDGSTDDLLVTHPKEGGIALMFWVVKAKNLEEALEGLEAELDEHFDDWDVDDDSEAEEIEINGMSGVSVEGGATVDGKACDLGVALLFTGDKVLIVVGVAADGHLDEHAETVGAIVMSIRKSK